jgi:hypothetical protein
MNICTPLHAVSQPIICLLSTILFWAPDIDGLGQGHNHAAAVPFDRSTDFTAGHTSGAPVPTSGVPSLDEMAGQWLNTSKLGLAPTINNFHGGLWAGEAWAPNAGGNVLAISGLALPPHFMPHNENVAIGNLSVDGHPLTTRMSRWFPYQVLRRAGVGGVQIQTAVRMVFEDAGVLFRTQLQLHETLQVPKTVDLRIGLNASNIPAKSPAQYWNGTGRSWQTPGAARFFQSVPCTHIFATDLRRHGTILTVKTFDPICPCATTWNNASADVCHCYCSSQLSTRVAFAFSTTPDQLHVLGAQSDAQGQASWKLVLQPGEIKTVDFVMAVGDIDAELIAKASKWAGDFNSVFAEAKDLWQRRFDDVFTPDNEHFSGNLPTLVTADHAISRTYYMGIVTLLGVERTNYPIAKRWYMTNGVDYQAQWFWDLWNLPTTMALADPEIMRGDAVRWLALDYANINAEDYAGRGAGTAYQANMASLFETANTYMRVTGDTALLDVRVQSQTVLEHLDDLATYWKRRAGSRDGQVLVNSTVMLSGKGFSLTCWVKNPAGQGAQGRLLEAPGAGNALLQIYLTIQDKIGACSSNSSEQADSVSTLTVPRDGRWHFVAVVSDGIHISYTVDEASETARALAGSMLPTHLDKLLIGNNCQEENCSVIHPSNFDEDLSNKPLRATMLDWRLYDRPLIPAQVAAIRVGSREPRTALAAAFKFSEGEGTVAADWSGHNRTASLSSIGTGLRWVENDAGRPALEFNTFIPSKGYLMIADYGTRDETWPSYIYRVPSYNMPNAWMMRTLADIYEVRGHAGESNASVVELRADARRLAKAIVEEMYVPGEGCWQSIYPNGRRVRAKNVQDVVYLAYIMEEIPLQSRSEIMEYIERELLLEHWMRGLSPLDPDANKSESSRCDGSQWGCYDGMVAYTIDAMFKLGFPARALDFLRRTVSVTYEGCYGNTHAAWGPNRNDFSAPIRKCEEAGGFNQQAGAGFTEVIIRTIFGFHGSDHGHGASESDTDDSVLYEPNLARGFNGTLLHVRHRGKLFTITSNSSTGLTMVHEPEW